MTRGPIIQHTILQGVRSSFIQIQIVDVVFLFDRSSQKVLLKHFDLYKCFLFYLKSECSFIDTNVKYLITYFLYLYNLYESNILRYFSTYTKLWNFTPDYRTTHTAVQNIYTPQWICLETGSVKHKG